MGGEFFLIVESKLNVEGVGNLSLGRAPEVAQSVRPLTLGFIQLRS